MPALALDTYRSQVQLADVTIRKLQPNDRGEVGLPGTRIWAGLIFEDPNTELQGQRGLRKLQQMSYDPSVAAVLAVHDRPLRATEWRVDPVDDSPEELQIADEVWWGLSEFGTQSFDDVLRQAHDRFTYGFSYNELVYDIVQGGEYDGHIAWSKIAYRHPVAKWRWDVDNVPTGGGATVRELVAVTQLAPPSYEYRTIPRSKLLLWVNNQFGENFDGEALIRRSYKPWFFKDLLLKIQAVGLQRAYMGVPVVTYPENFTPNEVAASQAIVENVRTSENAGVVHPEHLTFDIKTWQLNGTTMQEALSNHDRQILEPTLTQFLRLGSQGSTGSWALSEDQSELFLMQLDALGNYDAEVFNLEPGIPRLVAYNYGVRPQYPKLVHGPIGQRDFEKLARGIAQLSQWGVLTPDDSLEDAIRDQMSLPERDNTVTDESLKQLITKVQGDVWEIRRQHGAGRYPIPGTSAGTGEVVGGAAPNPGETALELPASGTPAAARFAEAMARRRWARPKGRLTDHTRRRIQATEEFAEAIDTYRSKMGRKMPKPSEWAARHRRPYVLRANFAEQDPAKRAEAKRQRTRGTVITRADLVAAQHAPKIRELLTTRLTTTPKT